MRSDNDNATQWLTLQKASEVLDVSIRTIHRRVKSGTYKTQRQTNGRVLVEVRQNDIPEALLTHHAIIKRLEGNAEDTQRLAGTIAALSEGQLTDMRQALESSQDRETKYRRASLAGWSLVACMAIVGGIGVVYGIGQVSESTALVGVYEAQNAATASDLEATRLSLSAVEVAASVNADRATTAQQEVESLRAEIETLETDQRSQYITGLLDGIMASADQDDQAVAIVKE